MTKVLVVDIGGNNVKILASGHDEVRKHPSGPTLTPARMAEAVGDMARDWDYDAVSIGFPGPVVDHHPKREPVNLGKGWVDFDYAAAFRRPVRMANDAAMQALGSYEGGKMLFLGLGTGMGSAVVAEHALLPMELAHLPYKKGRTYEDYAGRRGLDRMGRAKWEKHVHRIVELLEDALVVDYVVLGGGNSKKLETLPKRARPGHNDNAFVGGFRMWERED